MTNQTPAIARRQPQADYRITLDGRDLSRLIAPSLISLSLKESRSDEADTIDLVIDDSKNTFAIPKRGANIKVAIGWVGEPLVDKGTFSVDEVEHSGTPDILTIRARSASMTNQMHERREQSWHAQTIGSIVRAIAGRHSLKAAIADALATVAIAHIDQTHESDMSFLTRLAKRYDAVMNVKDLNLLFMPIGSGKSASGRALTVLNLTRADGDTHRYHVAQRESYSAVRAHYHSNNKGKRKSVVVGGENNRNVKVLPEDYATEAEARAAAEGEFARTQRSQATFSYQLALGRPEVFPELPVNVAGFKPEINETPWLVKEATHTLNGDGGLTTSLEMEVRDDPTTDRHRSHFRKGGQ
ncbi:MULTISPECIES: phage late control D family protein [Paraburkholderia]|uniref:phage late control D family protein n=1 Tax=Paraburkholderia TaxID=1822464 RepID=UPI002251947B|nr:MULTISPECIES: phage late control D family protein [Paraburkholderia]MCX4156989.1 phage late control D family protein [Paraburkholderia aspalathi]MDN7166393.1 phage late control D family protein [Paraburkholderia sp. SECH2]MDQ6394879.1 phage late control D family protein [Paraburkholderia aspalathi]